MGCKQSKPVMEDVRQQRQHGQMPMSPAKQNSGGNQENPTATTATTATTAPQAQQQSSDSSSLWEDARFDRDQWQQRLDDAARAKLDPCERPGETLKRVLEGDALPDSEIQALGTRQPAIRLFLSSTFTDTEVERNVLIEDVYPYLKSLGQRLRVQVYQSSEMRWGIRSEASAAHETSEICMREIKRCQQESSGISYVLILGNKYGFRPFPAKIPEEEFKLLKDEMAKQAKQAKQTASAVTSAALNKAMEYMDEWFVLNENVVPPTRELKPVKKEHSDAWWSDIFPTLQMCLRQAATGAPGLSDERRALYVQSVTAEEIDNGLFKVQPKEARDKSCFVFDRRLEGIDVALDPDTAKLFIDMAGGEVDEEAQQLLERSRAEAVPAALSPCRIKTMSIPWGPGIDLAHTDHAEYMRTFADAFCDTLAADIERVAREHAFESDTVVEEAAAHAMFGNLRRRGRTLMLPCIRAQRITSGKRRSSVCHLWPVWQCKTSLMAHIAGTIKEAQPAAVVVSRFLGTSRESGAARTLMANVYRHIHRAVKGKEPAASPAADFEKLTKQFQAALKLGTADKPLVLVLDSLDQLSDEDQGRNLEWLPLASLPPNCAIVVSSLPDVGGCWEVLKATLPDMNQQHVAKISKDDADGILSTWLADAKRSLTPAQRSVVLGAYESCPTPLYLRICTQFFALRWTHADAIAPDFFPKTVEGLMEKVFDELETRHGKETVRAALGYLSASRGGLSDNEMEDLLSCNDTVLDEIYEWWVPPVRRVPPLIWARIVSDLEGALVERGAEGGVTVRAWYHRQHREAAERRYLGFNSRSGAGDDTGDDSDGNGDGAGDGNTATASSSTTTASTSTTAAQAVQRHGELADYFSGKWEHGRHLHDKTDDASALRDRKVASMKTVLAGRLDDPRSGVVVNARKVAVLPFHLMHAQRWEECATTLCDLEFIEAKATAGMVHELTADFQTLQQSNAPESLLKTHEVPTWTRFVGANAHIFGVTPHAVVTRATLYPDHTGVCRAAQAVYATAGTRLPRVRRYNKPQQLDPRVALLKGLSRVVSAVRFTRDGKWVLAGGESGELRAWETLTATPVLRVKMPGKWRGISKIVQLPSGVVVTACAQQVHLWDLSTRELVETIDMLEPSTYFRELRMTDDDTMVVAVSTAESTPTKVFLQSADDLKTRVWEATCSEKLFCAQVRNNTLVAGTQGGDIVWFELQGAPTTREQVAAATAPVQGTLVEVARYKPEPAEGKKGSAIKRLCLLPDSLDAVAISGSHFIKVKADGTEAANTKLSTIPFGLTLMKGGSVAAIALFDESMALYDIETMTYLQAMRPTMTGAQDTSPDGMLVASAGTNFSYVSVFSVEHVNTDPNATDRDQEPLSFYAAPRIASLGGDGDRRAVFTVAGASTTIDLLDAATMEQVKTFDVSAATEKVSLHDMSADGRFIVGGRFRSANMFIVDTTTGEVHADVFSHGNSTDDRVYRVFFSPNSDMCVVANEYGSMCVVALPSCKVVFGHVNDRKATTHHTREVCAVAWHPQYPDVRQFATGSGDSSARLWQLSGNADGEGTPDACASINTFAGHEYDVQSVAFCTPPQGGTVLATCDEESGVWLWKLDEATPYARCKHVLEYETSAASSPMTVLWLPKQQLLVSRASNQNIKFWNLSGELVRSVKRRTNTLHLHPSMDYVVGITFGGLHLFDADTFEVAFQSYGHDQSQGGGSFRMSPDGRFFVSKWGDKAILTHDFSNVPL
ncbi:hypothetical protein PTSG_00754 [Salpingoeca rosetta]|uniref:DUF4062 domain-containing protein n=1 Tax=Salpingoeca rosetta (strain ATCC 50818 / BSB-021) TaxID=946362 RepID=F2TXD6_SALR5|nr:uncharacterized protein PTSG_00754 [Salpingoeca rosetta]EGD76045.1 hypothetical protein PTSG_00754 [Salpingoeca rosetta]|eukprot:XP_004998220.1 hypothetical protein PTSG_00754 [Salpingoeca rosetta]